MPVTRPPRRATAGLPAVAVLAALATISAPLAAPAAAPATAAAAVGAAAANRAAPPAPERPRDPFVFRCVLDENPRMVVVALAEDLSLAYDADAGELALAWAGDVKLQGAVYDTTHGPQPVHQGRPHLVARSGPAWMLAGPDGTPVAADVTWLGYRLDGPVVHLRFRLEADDVEPVVVTEIPEVRRDAGRVRLERVLRVEGDAAAMLVGPNRAAAPAPAADGDAPGPAPLDTSGPPPRRHPSGALLVPLPPGDETVVTIPIPTADD